MPLEVGQRLGDYEVQQMLGVGGMGHVYRVRNIISNRTEAMKVLLPDLSAEPDLATRFIAEIRTLASFDHPNIAQLHTALIAENQLIMMMEYVEGYTLEQLAKQRAMPVGEVAGYVSQALAALGYAHARGVVHRDVKPANLMVTSHGILKLMDFGIAKSQVENNNHTRPGTTMGSLYYMSPEQVRGDTVDARSDIYSAGIVLYELLAGRRPFEADTTFTILNKQLNEAPQPPIELNPAIPAGLNGIIMIALAKDPAQRFQNTDAFRNALRNFVTQERQEVAAPVVAPPMIAAALAAADAPSSATAMGPVSTSTQAPPVASPGFTEVPQPVAPQSYAAATASPTGAPKSNKGLWIATGAVAAVLALVAVGVAVPHWMKARAAASSAATAASSDVAPAADASVSATQPAEPTTSTPSTGSVAASPSGSDAASPSDGGTPPNAPTAFPNSAAPMGRPSSGGGKTSQMAAQGGGGPRTSAPIERAPYQGQSAGQPATPAAVAPAPSANHEELEQAQERMVDMNSRATTARRQVATIRSQQEASGLGLRGDVESAESRLDSYMNAAKSDLQRGNAAGATQELNKAEPELKTLEKFLGH